MANIRLEQVSKVFYGSRAEGLRQQRAQEMYGRAAGGTLEEEDRAGKTTQSGAVRALDQVDLEIADGETVSVIGPSGCGKSTLLRVIAGLETADSGQVFYDDREMTGVAPGDRGIGMVFQNYALYPHMESKGNLSFFFRIRKRQQEIDERVKITSDIMGVGFDQLLERKPKTLSGGQQQRVAIARCIVRDPALFLFDEPLSNLDAKLRARTRVEVKRLLARFKITAIYVTHDQIEALALADRIAVMRQGRIEQVGPYDEVYLRPVNAFVAGFVGSPPANFLPAVVADGRINFTAGSIALHESWRRRLTSGQTVLLGVRPEGFRLGQPGEPADISGEVDVVEPLIAERAQLVHVRVPSETADLDVTARIDAGTPIARGDRLPLRIDPERAMIFDRATERNALLGG